VYALPQQWGQATQGRIQHYAQGIEEKFKGTYFKKYPCRGFKLHFTPFIIRLSNLDTHPHNCFVNIWPKSYQFMMMSVNNFALFYFIGITH
jgi:hypothetical protein